MSQAHAIIQWPGAAGDQVRRHYDRRLVGGAHHREHRAADRAAAVPDSSGTQDGRDDLRCRYHRQQGKDDRTGQEPQRDVATGRQFLRDLDTAVPGHVYRIDGGPGEPADADARVSEFAFWSGKQRRTASPSFERGDLTAVMGGVELDLRGSTTAPGGAVIDVFVMWGGIEIWVPPDWAVANEVTVLLGGAEDRSTGAQDARSRLTVRGFCIMGGIEIGLKT